MKLYYTPKSHFSRKVRILTAGLGLEVNLIDIGNVADAKPSTFGPNPIMKVPTLIDDDRVVFDSDHIAQYLVRRHDPADQFGVLTDDVRLLNGRAVMNGIMAAEVALILAQRTGLDTGQHLRFQKIERSMRNGLDWLETHADWFPQNPSYAGFHLIAMWDHLKLYGLVPLNYPQLGQHVARLVEVDYISKSQPQ